MKKYDLGKPTVALNSNMKLKNVYVNSTKADLIIKDIEKQFDAITKSLNKIDTIMNKCVYKKTVKNEDCEAFLGWARVCEREAHDVVEIKKDFKYAYNDDVKNYTIKLLDDRIAALEKSIAELEK